MTRIKHLHKIFTCRFTAIALLSLATGCSQLPDKAQSGAHGSQPNEPSPGFLSAPLVSHIYTADPSAHSWNGKIYVYPSHDIPNDQPDDSAKKFDMKDYHVFSMDDVGGPVTDHGSVLHVDDVPWATSQMWAPDAATKDVKFYLYFPAKDKQGIFRIGVAISDRPSGPFKAEPKPIEGTYSIDPSVYQDDDGSYYLYVGGIWGGQLQHWDKNGNYIAEEKYPEANQPALLPRVAKLAADMVSLAEPLREVELLDESGQLITAGDNERRFFEAAWVHKYQGTYYFSYSTGDTHFIQYATGNSPYGPFTYQGKVLEPVLGWTNHHSIVEHNNKWYLFYHDSELSGGVTHLRNIKATELRHDKDGKIITISP